MMKIKDEEMQLGDVQVSPVLVTVCPVPCQGIVGHQHGMFHPCCPAANNSRTAMPGPAPGAPDRVCTHHVFNETEDNLQSHKQFSLNKQKKAYIHIFQLFIESLLYAKHLIKGCGRESVEKGRQI